jgi:hypothetical protein
MYAERQKLPFRYPSKSINLSIYVKGDINHSC